MNKSGMESIGQDPIPYIYFTSCGIGKKKQKVFKIVKFEIHN